MNFAENEDLDHVQELPSIQESKGGIQNFTAGEDDVEAKPEQASQPCLSILIVGKIGSGKSTLVNSLFGGKKIAQLGSSQKNSFFELHQVNIGGVHLSLYDTRGLGNPTTNRKFIEHLRHGSGVPSEFDLVLICIKIGEQIDGATISTINSVSSVFSENFWRRSIFLLTFTNQFELQVDNDIVIEMVHRRTRKLAVVLRNNLNVPPDIFKTIPFCNVGQVREGKEESDKKLSTSDDWVDDVLEHCKARCSEKCKGSMTTIAKTCIGGTFVSAVLTGGSVAIGATVGGIIGGVVGSLFFPGMGTVGGAVAGAQWGGGIVGATGAFGGAAFTVGKLGNYFKEVTGNKLHVQKY